MGDYVEIDGIRTWYDEEGAGPPLVLLHGGLVTNESWEPQMPALTKDWRVFAPERRGHGRTPDVDGPFSYEDMANDTIGFLESVVREPAPLVGWSDGGTIGLLVATKRPDLVTKLVLIGAGYDASGWVIPADEMVAGMSPDDPDIAMLRKAYSAVSPDGAEHWPVVFEKVTTMWTKEPHIPVEDLKKLEAPVLVVVGDDDLVSLNHTIDLYEALPNAALAVVPFASHRVLMERSDLVNAMVVEFLKGDPPPTMMPIRRSVSSS